MGRSPGRSDALVWPLSVVFAITGASALILQVSWQRVISMHSGVDLTSATLVVAGFLAGLFAEKFKGQNRDGIFIKLYRNIFRQVFRPIENFRFDRLIFEIIFDVCGKLGGGSVTLGNFFAQRF